MYVSRSVDLYIILDLQLLSEFESLAAVPAEIESEQEDLNERIFLVAEVNISWRLEYSFK